ncbi:hypothetical protein [Blastococcus sp. TF02A-30]|uniref:hypothetical protein n=1 Tax=Blastococcus sp. TF02A-30 TaxID=2250580 RepID=UPI0011BE1F93|nr:hypothetical protein [Blastococcus sp. TF02A-30]
MAVLDDTGAVVRVLEAGPAAPPVDVPPFAEVVSVTAGRDTRFLQVSCPLCGKVHHHAHPWDDDASETGRVAHCGRGDYRIAIPAVKLVGPGRAGRGGAR